MQYEKLISKISILIGRDDKTELLELLIENATEEILNYCNLEEYNTKLDSLICKIVVYNYNRLGTEGLNSTSYSELRENYTDGYGEDIVRMLNKNRRLKTLW